MKVYGIGRFAKDLELRYTTGGTAALNTTLAWDTGFGDNKKTSFVTFVFMAKNAENVQKFFNKGDQIFIESGELQQRVWEDTEGKKHYAVEVFVKEWGFCGGAKKNDGEQPTGNNDIGTQVDIDDENLPF